MVRHQNYKQENPSLVRRFCLYICITTGTHCPPRHPSIHLALSLSLPRVSVWNNYSNPPIAVAWITLPRLPHEQPPTDDSRLPRSTAQPPQYICQSPAHPPTPGKSGKRHTQSNCVLHNRTSTKAHQFHHPWNGIKMRSHWVLTQIEFWNLSNNCVYLNLPTNSGSRS